MPSDPLWLPASAVIEFNRQAVLDSSENHALLDSGKLDGALMRPRTSYFYDGNRDIVSLARNYMVAIAKAHDFEQGNKRTGFIAGFAFLQTNGYDLVAEADDELLAVAFIEAIDGTAADSRLENLLKRWAKPL